MKATLYTKNDPGYVKTFSTCVEFINSLKSSSLKENGIYSIKPHMLFGTEIACIIDLFS